MQRILKTIIVSLVIFATFFSSFASTNSLTEAQKDQLIQLGYPSSYRIYLNDWYNEIKKYDPFSYGSFSHFGMLCNFVSAMKYETDKENLPDFAAIARATYDEVSDVSASVMVYSLKGIWDSLTNRVLSPNFGNSYTDAALGLNSYTDWYNPGVINPLEDSSGDSVTREALLKAYTISFKKHRLGANPGYPHFKLTNLPNNYCYFYESNRPLQPNEIRRGAFIHSKVFITQ